MKRLLFPFLVSIIANVLPLAAGGAPIKVLLIDGQNNHAWKQTTPVLKQLLENDRLCEVTVATAPPARADKESFQPQFDQFEVVVSNYNGERWNAVTEAAFVRYVRNGGGFVPVHAANNSFPDWPEYNEMIGLGGWGNRNEKSGPKLRLRDGRFTADPSPGPGGHHGSQHAFVMHTRAADHPIMAGLPPQWMHAKDELYDQLRGPAKNLVVLASAYSDPKTGGTGEHEPLLMAITYGQGRVFHTALGHSVESIKCAGFATTLRRGTEWAARGKVTQAVPKQFPDASKVVSLD